MRRVPLRALTCAVVVAATAAAIPVTASAACRASLAPSDEAALATMINTHRSAKGVKAVARHSGLTKIGRKKSLAMAKGARFAHSGDLPWANGRAAGQNLAMATTPREAFRAMLASPAHRENMLASQWRFGGVGAARNCQGIVYFTVNLMAPAPRA